MTLFKEWQDLIGNQTDDSIQEFWKEYTQAEVKIYSDVLENYKTPVTGNFKELYAKYSVTPVLYMGFLDGINSSLKEELALDDVTEESAVTLDIDFEKLYYNMHAAGANHLYELDQWEPILSLETRSEIAKDYKRSKTVTKEKTPGRNDPCPCGSGKKYKKCCGANS